jgi:CHAD domain-containing protein
MNGSAKSHEDAHGELTREISTQLERAREALEAGTDLASSVHEARRAIKRSRALLRLANPWPRDSDTDCTLRDASRALAVLRDADIVALTAEDIRSDSRSSEPHVVPLHLLESLEEVRRRRFAEAGSADGPLRVADELLRSVTVEIREPQAPQLTADHEPTTSGGMALLRLGLGASYESVRARSDPAAGEGPVDERSHKLRKRVKDLRYQLEFLDTGHPKLGRLVRDLHHLTDLLGDTNDLVTLSRYTASAGVLCEAERAVLTAHIEEGKQVLRSEAAALSARLFEEEPDSFVRRIEAWVTPPQDPDQGRDQGQDQG